MASRREKKTGRKELMGAATRAGEMMVTMATGGQMIAEVCLRRARAGV